MDLKHYIRDIQDFPKPGIIFKDITTLLKDRKAFNYAIEELKKALNDQDIDAIAGIESRGFIFGSALAFSMGIGFIPVRKFGKLPSTTFDVEYELEYGTDQLSIHTDAIVAGQKIAIIDDVLATGGTARATADLIEKAGGEVSSLGFIMGLSFLKGLEKINKFNVITLINY
ncbi:MAG: adenine phosphoribosyltransferase [Candidatus Margulisiibacteriota bacterium]|nr:MAG: adenine phosphoribosyltransferase [Candidatus Margulisbacteria bacterium GWD2_39_127]OGI01668.1 MAG: adenine phosphoribosyltransferase [Candidatus Margulisbacteria bacterium GWF2_38_17]OGI05857.1 MAG: adenine phosphoribosyltransferase [Candidatus Margulisbacteria bacterium GWE2_39_32]PZM81857.1 MAG: adenine phosphoribosyltransferase [Candidatus Margulisiibacteriota bacterium]HAR63115.1 adenine phosphoribosyltransferase [Candidatus Margulisiibacteriota bacterium]